MQIEAVSGNSFGAKNTFYKQAMDATCLKDKEYYKSLYFEAKSRMHYLEYRRLNKQLFENNSEKSLWEKIKLIGALIKQKCKSAVYQGDAYGSFPERFPDPGICFSCHFESYHY